MVLNETSQALFEVIDLSLRKLKRLRLLDAEVATEIQRKLEDHIYFNGVSPGDAFSEVSAQ